LDSTTTTQEDRKSAVSSPATPGVGAGLKAIRILMAVGWTLVILVLCWTPGAIVNELEQGSPWLQIPDLDKVIHWGIFTIFTLLWLRTGTSPRRYLWVGLAGLALAVITEVGQNILPVGRDGEVGDTITDLIGVAIGLVAARWVEPPFRWAESVVFGRPAA
jgi:VanZ like family